MIYYDKEKRYTRKKVGGKALGLLSLLRMGYFVPDFFIIPTYADITSAEFALELQTASDKLGGDCFAVRSSAVAEDTRSRSFAGQYDTLLNVPKNELLSAVTAVRNSVQNTRVQTYANAATDIAVIVQKQIFPRRAGVAFSTSPFDCSKAIVESAEGIGEALVSGVVTPKTFVFDKTSPVDGIEGEVFLAVQRMEQCLKRPIDVEWAYDGTLYFLQVRPLTVLPVRFGTLEGEWNEYVYRDFAFFNEYVQALASQSARQRTAFGFSIPIFEGVLVNGHEFYSAKNDMQTQCLWKRLDKGDFFDVFAKNVLQSVSKTKRRVRALQNTDITKLDTPALCRKFHREIQWYIQSYLPLMMRPDEYLTDALGWKDEQQLFTATYVTKPTYYGSERLHFLRAALAYYNGDSSLLRDYVHRYEWTQSPLGKCLLSLTQEQVLSRIHQTTPAEIERALAELTALRKQHVAARKKAWAAVNNTKDKQTLAVLSKFVHLRTYTTENSDRYFYYIKKMYFTEISNRLGVSVEDLLYCTPDEIEKLLHGAPYPALAQARKLGVTIFFKNGKFRISCGNGLALMQRLLPKPNDEDMLHGAIASPGHVCGTVRIIQNSDDLIKLQAGDILVTKMTTPDLVCAMEKAAGIITDEGGVTCHAAILAREYAVPCLVGCRVATKLLKDGMEIELDCVHGTCKTIKTT